MEALKGSKIPAALRDRLTGYREETVTLGCSGDLVLRLTRTGDRDLFLKVSSSDAAALVDEARRLRWLGRYLPVPQVIVEGREGDQAWLLTTACPGVPAQLVAMDPQWVVQELARGLRWFHALPVDECPFDARLDVRLREAKQRLDAGLVDEADFDPERQGLAAADLYPMLLRDRPASEDLVVTHGDTCLPNILLTESGVAGFVDVGRAGIADRYQDLALAARSIRYNLGEALVPLFFKAYGVSQDAARVAYYQLLDEFF